MKPRRTAAGFLWTFLALLGACGQDAAARDDAGTPGAPAGPVPTTAQLRAVLKDATEALKKNAEAKDDGNRLPDFRAMFERVTGEETADVLRAIGAAQVAVGDRDAAAQNWQDAVDGAAEITDPAARADTLINVAASRLDGDDRDEALATLQQALQAVRRIKAAANGAGASVIPRGMLPGADDDVDAKQARLLVRVAALQERAGDHGAAGKSIRQAGQSVGAVENDLTRASLLAVIAAGAGPAGREGAWAGAFDFALSVADPSQRALAVERVLRARTRADGAAQPLRVVADRLKGDLQAYALWTVTDAVARLAKPLPDDLTAQLLKLAAAAEYDKYPKKIKVYSRIAELQAAAGDADGAERSVGMLNTDNPIRRFRFIQTRVKVLGEIARAHLKAGRKDAARETLRVALEIIAPFEGDDGDQSFPVAGLAESLARAGEFREALATAAATSAPTARVDALASVAVVQAASGDPEGAKKTFEKATVAADEIPKNALWAWGTNFDPDDDQTGIRERFGGPASRYSGLLKIAAARARAGDHDGALKAALAVVNESKDKYKGGWLDAFATFREIATVRANAGDFSAALKTVEAFGAVPMFREAERTRLLADLARMQAVAGDPRGVLDWALKQSAPKTKAMVIKAMAEGITAQKKGDQAPPPATP